MSGDTLCGTGTFGSLPSVLERLIPPLAPSCVSALWKRSQLLVCFKSSQADNELWPALRNAAWPHHGQVVSQRNGELQFPPQFINESWSMNPSVCFQVSDLPHTLPALVGQEPHVRGFGTTGELPQLHEPRMATGLST